MTETQLNLGNELNEQIKHLEKARVEYKDGFDCLCESDKNHQQIIVDFLGHNRKYFNFPIEELQKLFEKKIIEIDSKLESLKFKFKQL